MHDSLYFYTDGDLIAVPQRYFYTQLHGPAFLSAYRSNREMALIALERTDRAGSKRPLPVTSPFDTMQALADPVETIVDKLIGRFEITRKIHTGYDTRIVKGNGLFTDPAPYARLARRVGERVMEQMRLTDLNVLLKLNDVLISRIPIAGNDVIADMRAAISAEQNTIADLIHEQRPNDGI